MGFLDLFLAGKVKLIKYKPQPIYRACYVLVNVLSVLYVLTNLILMTVISPIL